jgi:hypothetical protein
MCNRDENCKAEGNMALQAEAGVLTGENPM